MPPDRNAPSGTSATMLPLDRVAQQRVELVDDGFEPVGTQRGLPLPRDRREIPIEMPRRPVRGNLDTLARHELFHLAIDRLRRRDAGVAQIGRDAPTDRA